MPPLECANFLERENKTVCVAPFLSLRLSFWIQPLFFPSYTRKLSQFTLLSFFFFSFFFFLEKKAWNAIVCETTDVSHETATLPIFQKTWFQAIFAEKKRGKKNGKEKKHGVRRFYGVRRFCRARGFYSMCTSLAVECDVPCGVRRIYGMRRILSMRGWFRDHIGKFRGQNQNSNQSQPKLPGAHQWVLFFRVHLGWGPGEETG